MQILSRWFACAAAVCLATSVQGEWILWVSDNGAKGTEPGSDGVTRGVFYPASSTDGTRYVDQDFVDLLTAAGHTVTRFNPNPQSMSVDDVAEINRHDLVILGTALNSGPFNLNSRGAKWNTSITKPMIITKSTLIRRDRMGYLLDNKEFDCAANASTTASGKWTLVEPGHPIFKGIATTPIVGGAVVDNPVLLRIAEPANNRGTSVQYFKLLIDGVDQAIANASEPGGRVLATMEFNPMDPGVNIPAGQAPSVAGNHVATGYAVVEWPAGTVVRTTQVADEKIASYRLLFACGTRDASGSVTAAPHPEAGALDLSAEGRTMFMNAVAHALQQGPPRLLSSTWGEWDYKQYLYGGVGNLVLSNQTSSGFTAWVATNDVDVVTAGTFEKVPDGVIEPAGRPTIYQEFGPLELSRVGQKVTASFDLKFNNVLGASDQFVRFGFGNPAENAAFYLKMDSGLGGGTTLGWRSDSTISDTNGATLISATFDPNGNLAAAKNLNYPVIGPNNGFVPGNYSHFMNSGSFNVPGSTYPPALSAYPNGVGLGVEGTLDTVHSITMTMERVEGGLKIGASWSNSAGEEVLTTGESGPYIDAPQPEGHGRLDKIGCLGFNLMNHDLFNNGAVGGSYVVSRFRLEYVTPPELRITRIVRAANTGKVTLTWSSVAEANYTIETSTELSTWTAVTPGVVSQGDNTSTEIDATGTAVYFRIRQD